MSHMKGFHIADYAVLAASLCVSLGIGVYHGCFGQKQKSAGQFLMADRDLKVFPLTLSLVVSVISAVTILGLPAEMYTQGSQYFFNFGSGVGMLLTTLIFVPLLFPLRLTSMFEYLELRFKSRSVRLVGSSMEMLALVLYAGTALFAPATALVGVTGSEPWMLIVGMGLLVISYTSIGGIKGVIWADVFQAFIMFAAICLVTVQGCMRVGGVQKVWDICKEGGRLQFYNFDPDPSIRHTFWGLTLGFGFGGLSFYGASQFTFQRFSATKTLNQARSTVLLNIPIFYAFHILLCITGLVIYAFYSELGCDPLKSGEIRSPNQLLPLFVVDLLSVLPGLPGLFVAALISGALSTVSSVLNSIAALLWEDVFKGHFGHLSDHATLSINKITVVIAGLAAIGLAFLADNFGPHIFQVCFAFLGASGGPQLGLFLLGALFPRANAKGAIVGCLTGLAFTSWIIIGSFVTKPFKSSLPPLPITGCLPPNVSMATGYNSSQMYNSSVILRDVMLYADNVTTTASPILPHQEIDGLSKLYTVSYVWYSAIGATVAIIVGLIVSYITGPNHPEDVSSHLFISFPWRCRGNSKHPVDGAADSSHAELEDAEKCREALVPSPDGPDIHTETNL